MRGEAATIGAGLLRLFLLGFAVGVSLGHHLGPG